MAQPPWMVEAIRDMDASSTVVEEIDPSVLIAGPQSFSVPAPATPAFPAEVPPGAAKQPHPKASRHPSVWILMQEDFRARVTEGVHRYGVPLTPHNGRDALTDAYQEALDLAMYLRQLLYERDAK